MTIETPYLPGAAAPVRVRPVIPADRDALLALAPRLLIGMAPWREPDKMLAFMRDAIVTALAATNDADRADAAVFVAVDSRGGRLGFVTVARNVDFTGDVQAYVGELAVAAPAEGAGVGQALMGAAEGWAWAQGYRLLVLDTGAANVRARAFYARRGYTEESVRLVKILDIKQL